MKNFITAIAIVLFPMAQCIAADKVLAEYNGTPVYENEIVAKLKAVLNGKLPDNKKSFDDLDKDTKTRIIQEIVSQKVLEQAAAKSNFEKSDGFKKQLDEIIEQIKINLFLDHQAKKNLNEDVLKSEYANYVKELKSSDDLKVSHILVKDESEATKLADEIKNSKISFEDAAKKNSLDPGSKDKGGNLDYISKGQLVPEFEKAAYSLKKDEISKPVQTQYGWHIIKVTDIRKKQLPSYESLKPQLEQHVMMKLKQQYIAELLKNADVKIYPDGKKN